MSRRKRPAPPQHRPIPNHTTTDQPTAHRGQDGYAGSQGVDASGADLHAWAERRGYRGRPLIHPISLIYHRGPTCRHRAAATPDD